MSHNFKLIKPYEITDNVFSLIGHDWMLVTSGTPESFNTMTASWGGLGVLWNKNVCFVFVRRPTRYTYEFMEKNETFSLSFFPSEWKSALNFCGTKSGRDVDKIKETGLKPFQGQNKTICFEQARLLLECKKLYFQDIDPGNFQEKELDKLYPLHDYHRMYVGEILSCMISDKT